MHTLPEIGKIYAPSIDPTIRFLVEAVYFSKADGENEARFAVEVRDPADTDNASALSIAITGEEWTEFGFSIVPESLKIGT